MMPVQVKDFELDHHPEWYLQPEHILLRPSIGLFSLGKFAVWLLYATQRNISFGSRSHVQATRLVLRVQKRMTTYMKRGGKTKRLTRTLIKGYAGACRALLPLASHAYELYQQELEKAKKFRGKKIIAVDAVHEDMI